MVAQACNTSYSGGRDKEYQDSSPGQEKSKIPFSTTKPLVVAHTYCPSYSEGSQSKTSPSKKHKTHVKINLSKKGWRCASSYTALV
jgi:hypothetical protein